MSRTSQKKAFLPERGIAWIITVLLAVIISTTALGTLAVQLMTSAGLHISTSQDAALLNSQVSHIYEKIDLYSEEYRFSADAVKTVITPEEIKELNRRAAEWWTGLLTEGKTEAVPHWYSEELLETISATMPADNQKEDPRVIAADLTDIVERTVFPMRGTLMTKGMDLAQSKADIPGIIRTVRKLPPLGLVLCILAAGMIALLLGREIQQSLKHFGTALAGAGIIIISTMAILKSAGISGMITEASEGLAGELGAVTGKLGVAAAGISLVLLAAGYFCLHLYRKKTTTERSA